MCRAVHIVKMVTFKMFLVENSAIRAQKGVSLWATTSIIANTIDLTSRLDINIHSRLDGSCSTGEFGGRNIGMTWKVNTANTFGMSMVRVMVGGWVRVMGVRGTIPRSGMGRMMGGMFVGVICTMGEIRLATGTLEFSWGTIAGFRCSIPRCRCGFMVSGFWRWRSIRFRNMRSWSMVRSSGSWSMVGSNRCRFVVGRCRRNIGSGFMVGWCWRNIGSRSRGMVRFNFRGWSMIGSSGGWGMIKGKFEWCSYSWGGGMMRGDWGWSRGIGRMSRGMGNITTEGADIRRLVWISFGSFIFFSSFLVGTNCESIVKN